MVSDPCLSCMSCLSVTLVYCGQTVGWIKMPLCTEVGLVPGDIVLDGDPAPPRKGSVQQPLTSRSMSMMVKWSPISATAELLYNVQSETRPVLFAISWPVTERMDFRLLIEPHNLLPTVATHCSLFNYRPFCSPSRAIGRLYVCPDDNFK